MVSVWFVWNVAYRRRIILINAYIVMQTKLYVHIQLHSCNFGVLLQLHCTAEILKFLFRVSDVHMFCCGSCVSGCVVCMCCWVFVLCCYMK